MPSHKKRTALYRFYGARDILLYVGVTDQPGRRWEEHVKEKPWWRRVRRQTVDLYDSREAAEAAERQAIEDERPVYNTLHAREPDPLSPEELRLLLYDLDAVMGAERVRLSELPARLRFLAPDIPLYRKLNGVRLLAALGGAGVRTTNIGNVPRLDPGDLRVVLKRAG